MPGRQMSMHQMSGRQMSGRQVPGRQSVRGAKVSHFKACVLYCIIYSSILFYCCHCNHVYGLLAQKKRSTHCKPRKKVFFMNKQHWEVTYLQTSLIL